MSPKLPANNRSQSSTQQTSGHSGKPRRSLAFGEFRWEEASGILYRGEVPIPVPPRALKILRRLLESPGELVEKAELMRVAWDEVAVSENSLSEVIRLLRSALTDDSQNPQYIQTVHRRGYRLVASVSVEMDGAAEVVQNGETTRTRRWPGPLIVIVFLGALAFTSFLMRTPPGTAESDGARPPLAPRFELHPPENARLSVVRPGSDEPLIALSADGRRLVYVGNDAEGVQQLFLRELEGLEVKPLQGTEGASYPFFSPDGEWVAFFVNGKLKKVAIGGGPPSIVAEATGGFGGDWGEPDTLVYVTSFAGDLVRVSASGGGTEVVLARTRLGESVIAWPRTVPARGVLYTEGRELAGQDTSIGYVAFETGEPQTVVEDGSSPFFVPPNFLVFARDGSLWAAPLDMKRMKLHRPPRLLENDVLTHPPIRTAQIAISSNGALAYAAGGSYMAQEGRRIALIDRSGRRSALDFPSEEYASAFPSPDGRQLALGRIQDSSLHAWIYDLETAQVRRLTYDGSLNQPMAWSPDGKWVAFFSDRSGAVRPYRKMADGSGTPEPITSFEASAIPSDWSRDGEVMVFDVDGVETGIDIWLWNFVTGEKEPIVRTPHNEQNARLAHDMRWVAYQSTVSGREEIYVRSFSEPAETHQVTTEGGEVPQWSPTGDKLFYLHGKGLWSVAVRPSGTFFAGPPRLLFEGNFMPGYGVLPDGRFAMIEKTTPEGPTHIVVVLNLVGRLRHLFDD